MDIFKISGKLFEPTIRYINISCFHDPNASPEILNNDHTRILEWAYRWKTSFNLDPSKQAQEVLFSIKVTKTNHLNIIFNGNTIKKVPIKRTLV